MGRPEKYPWSEMMDGSTWRAKRGEDFTCSVDTFRHSLHSKARQVGLKVKTSILGGGVVEFQFYQGAASGNGR